MRTTGLVRAVGRSCTALYIADNQDRENNKRKRTRIMSLWTITQRTRTRACLSINSKNKLGAGGVEPWAEGEGAPSTIQGRAVRARVEPRLPQRHQHQQQYLLKKQTSVA